MIRHGLDVTHGGGTQQRSDSRALSNRYYRWNCRNRLLFAARHVAVPALLGWLLHTPAESWQILMRGGRRQLIHSPQPLLAVIRGSLEGAAVIVRVLVRGDAQAVRRG